MRAIENNACGPCVVGKNLPAILREAKQRGQKVEVRITDKELLDESLNPRQGSSIVYSYQSCFIIRLHAPCLRQGSLGLGCPVICFCCIQTRLSWSAAECSAGNPTRRAKRNDLKRIRNSSHGPHLWRLFLGPRLA